MNKDQTHCEQPTSFAPLHALSDEELTIKIAEACPKIAHVIRLAGYKPVVFWIGRTRNVEFRPLYDLNAMHEAEKILEPMSKMASSNPADYPHWVYCGNLFKVLGMKRGEIWGPKSPQDYFVFCHATARQRAEAFVLTLGGNLGSGVGTVAARGEDGSKP